MKILICLLVTFGVAYGLSLPLKPNCMNVFCTMDLKICPDGTPAPVPANGCCPSLSACAAKPVTNPIRPIHCAVTFCTMDLKICPDGTPAPIPAGECCPSLKACPSLIGNSRSNPLGSLLSGGNLLQTLSSATHGTDLGTVLTILNLLNNLQQFSNDIHQIPLLINQTLVNILNGTGQASQIVVDQLIGAVTNVNHQSNSRDLLGSLGQNANLLSSIGHLLPQGTSISTIISILKLLNNINQFSNDVHQIPVLLNQTVASLVGGAGQASELIVQQLLGLLGSQTGTSRDLLGSLGQSANLLSSISHILPQGTSISTIISILKLLNNINQFSNDVHQIPVLLNQTLASLVGGAGQASELIVQQLLGLIGSQTGTSRDLLGSLGQNANLLSSIGHLLPQGTSISTIISILKLLNNINQFSNDVHQIPVLLNQTLATLLGGAGQASQIVIDQLLGLVGMQSQAASRDLLGALGQNANLLSTVSHLLPQGTSISTVISLLNLLNNVNALNNDLHQIPTVLQSTIQNLLNGVQNILPPLIQPLQGSS